MKKFKFYISILVAISIFAVSCTKNNATHIPKDAFAVMVIDGKESAKVFDTKTLTENEEYKNAVKEVESMSKKLAELLEKIAKNPDASGILLTKKIYAFTQFNKDAITVGTIIPINKKTLEENIDLVSKELGFPIGMLIKEKNKIKYVEADPSTVLGWNKDIFILLYSEANNLNFDSLEKLMNLKESESIMSDKDFKNFHKNCKAFNIWVSSNIIEKIDIEKEAITEFQKLTGIDLKNNYGHFIIDVQKGEVSFTAKMRFNESIQNLDQKKIMGNADKISELLETKFGKIIDLISVLSNKNTNDTIDEIDYNSEISEEEWEELINSGI
ncbi:MAG TPA: DUF4836 family protein [Bacteroidales bacterium]|jgi:hypothetical protein|nr:DUF4836 family protein [Bacteroidales bacterium]HOL97160.1 DUF4836 family protein [Bacteroidales bacterium]HOM35453.1 DUF4836 family protein [Bacteroidales bacterium]HPD23056.1 DUF4836 family protein [Bacteroidales bacterium]HRS99344.1 DUF4836 family protein [Bacteroidales bacterium]